MYGQYSFIISAVSTKHDTLKDYRISLNIEEFSEAFPGLPNSSQTDIHSGED
jgi:hypothetical protein